MTRPLNPHTHGPATCDDCGEKKLVAIRIDPRSTDDVRVACESCDKQLDLLPTAILSADHEALTA